MQIIERESRAEGLRTHCSETGELDVQSNDLTPPEQLENLEDLLELPQGEQIGLDGVEALRRFFELIGADVRGRRGPRVILRRVLGIAHRCGALRSISLEELGKSADCSRQNLHQSATAVEERLGSYFPREAKGPGRGARKSDE